MDKQEQLNRLKRRMEEDATLPLRQKDSRLVFGAGNPDSKILFLGEAPGYFENLKGLPFIGNAGALLNQLLQSIKVGREDVWISNVVCYRPPSNRDPEPSEIAAFQPYIDEMINIINPKVIVTLGRFSMGKFLPGNYISSVHGKEFRVNWNDREITVVPMYHPAAALRRNDVREQLKADFLRLPEIVREASKPKVKQMNLV